MYLVIYKDHRRLPRIVISLEIKIKIGWNKISHHRELSNYRELLNDVEEVNNPQLHVVH